MNPIAITVTGRLGDDPRPFTTRDGTPGVELRLALDLPSRTPGGDGITRWVKVTAFGLLASRTAESVRKGDRVTVVADDFTAEAWAATGTGEPRARITLRAADIAAPRARTPPPSPQWVHRAPRPSRHQPKRPGRLVDHSVPNVTVPVAPAWSSPRPIPPRRITLDGALPDSLLN